MSDPLAAALGPGHVFRPSRLEVLAARARKALDERQGRTSPKWLEDLASLDIETATQPDASVPSSDLQAANPDAPRIMRLLEGTGGSADLPRTYKLGDRALARLPGRLIHGDDVRELQTRLADMGYDEVGPADGVFGSATELAVRRFQNDFGILNDGVCGRVTARVVRFLQGSGAGLSSDVSPAQRNLISFIVHAQHSGLILLDLVSRRLPHRDQTTAALEDLLLESLGNQLDRAIERMTGMQTWIVGMNDFATDEDNLVSFATNIGSELFLTLNLRSEQSSDAGCVVSYFGDTTTGIHSNIGRPLALFVYEELDRIAHPPSIDLRPEQTSLFQRVEAPTIRVEFGNLASQRDRDHLLRNDEYIEQLAEGIARGIKRLYLLGQQDDESTVLNLGTFARRMSTSPED
jgi:N-acetylmuramoyl-L-alanine amidase